MRLHPLSYAAPRPPEPTVWLHRVAQLCGVLPLAFGTFVFLMFLATRDRVLILVGMWTILGGLAAALVGVVCACVYLFQARNESALDHTRARQAGYRDIAIIALNFPVAVAMVLIGMVLLPGW